MSSARSSRGCCSGRCSNAPGAARDAEPQARGGLTTGHACVERGRRHGRRGCAQSATPGRTETAQADDGDAASGGGATGYHGRVMVDVAEGRWQERRFCLVFALLSVVIFAVLYAAGDGVVSALNRHIAWTAALALRGLGISAAAAGALVSAGGFAVEIKNNCNAIYEVGLYAAAVGAYPASLGAKAAGPLVSAGVLYAVNLALAVPL